MTTTYNPKKPKSDNEGGESSVNNAPDKKAPPTLTPASSQKKKVNVPGLLGKFTPTHRM